MIEAANHRDLVTFAVFGCDQEKFVRPAVESAFAQTYSPLEIILSDDCSSDGTFEILKEMAAAYRGPHKIVLNRNPTRRGIGGHFNKVVEMARGELIVVQAADDISLPQRTVAAYETWRKSGNRVTSIHSDFIQIDENGREIEPIFRNEEQYPSGAIVDQPVEPWIYVQSLKPILFGCTHAFSKGLYRIFGDMPDHITHEDDVLGFRSILVGGLLYVNEPLVKYRLHGANAYLNNGKSGHQLRDLEHRENRLRREWRNRETMYGSFRLDLQKARQKGLTDKATFEKTIREIERAHQRYLLMGRFLEESVPQKIKILSQLRKIKLSKAERNCLTKRLIPKPIFLRVLRIRHALHFCETNEI